MHTLARLFTIAIFATSTAAFAQKAAETTNSPQRAGEASTMTGGAPNAKTTNESTTTTDKSAKKPRMASSAAKGSASAAGTSNVPARAGEASTTTNGVPNKKTTN